ncbi:MAG: hypothetical protein V9E87_16755, partial [Gemmatimonadales bacterium]
MPFLDALERAASSAARGSSSSSTAPSTSRSMPRSRVLEFFLDKIDAAPERSAVRCTSMRKLIAH